MEPDTVPPAQPQTSTPNSVPPPLQPVVHTSDQLWVGFQNILTFISMSFFAGALHTLWVLFISHWLPITENFYYSILPYMLNGALAALIVSAPFFIILFLLTNLKYIRQPELKRTTSKKILNYITLVATFLILLLRIISAINNALNQKFTVNFGLELLVTLLIIGTIFIYYLFEVRFEKQPASKWIYIGLAAVQIIVALTTLTIGIYIRSDQMKKATTVNKDSGRPYVPPGTYPVLATPTPTPTPILAKNLPSAPQTVEGIELTVLRGEIRESGITKTMVLSIQFSANTPCPLTGGAVCGVNSPGIKVTDKDGYRMQRLAGGVDQIQNGILQTGEKTKGNIYFNVTESTGIYYVTYSAPSGLTSKKIELNFSKL